MIRWLRGETVEDSCPELALIFCAMVAKGILSPFSVGCSLFILSNVSLSFYQLFPFSSISFSLSSVSCFSLFCQVLLFSFHWIFLFSCCRRLCVLSFYRPLLSARTSWCEYHVEHSAATYFLRPICTFCTLNP